MNQSTSHNPRETFPRRPYGRKGQRLSIIGFGGIIVMNAQQDHANRTVARAVERGINYFDVAPSYGDAEQRLGPALQPHRKNCFLACKTGQRDAAGAGAELRKSMENLRTDYFDLYQLHALSGMEDVDAVFARGGAMEVLIEGRKSGQLRHLGFSAHCVEAALAAMDRFDFDSILFPINFATFHKCHFGPTVIEKARQQGVSVLALKGLARQKWPENDPQRQAYGKCWYQPLTDPRQQDLALRFTLSQPITAAVPPGEEALFWAAVEIGERFQPVNEDEVAQLRTMAAQLEPVFTA